MSYELIIQDLPNEMLEKILQNLDLEDRKSALCVCKRWSMLKILDVSSVQLVLDTGRRYNCISEYHETLLVSIRRYKHVVVYIRHTFRQFDQLMDILRHFSPDVESLKLRFEPVAGCLRPQSHWSRVRLNFFAEVTAMFSRLKHLYVDEGGFHSRERALEYSPMCNLKEVYLKNSLPALIPNIHDIMPNITKLKLLVASPEAVEFLRQLSPQLVELELWVQREEHFLTMCSIQFPVLQKVKLSSIDIRFEVFTSSLAMFELIENMDELKSLTLQDLLFDDVGQILELNSCKNVHFLSLAWGSRSSIATFALSAVREMTDLKELLIENAVISVPNEFVFPPLPNLHTLLFKKGGIADCFKFNRFVQYAFPKLVAFGLLEMYDWEVHDMFYLCNNLCVAMDALNRIELSQETTSVELGRFLEFCSFSGCKEVKIRCNGITESSFPPNEPAWIPVETLFVDATDISRVTLQTLIQTMRELKRIELTVDEEICSLRQSAIDIMQEDFPRCKIILKFRDDDR